ncbi:aldose epimerase family protein [Sphingomonas qilianensis]|uniref:aldose epimerase family protein n=1 Tax=Sphingomonas qilianensis TaxID=1736690 RepID=UPI0031F50E41
MALTLATPASAQMDDGVIELRDGAMVVRLIPFGAAVTQIKVPDRDGTSANVLLGFATPAEFRAKNDKVSFGATIGRYAGRIAGARLSIDGTPVQLVANDGPNALHGGGRAKFDTQLWSVRKVDRRAVTFTLDSPDGFQNFPGRLQVAVTYRLIGRTALRIDYEARTSKPTALNLTNHAYFNLAGEGSGSIRAQRLQLMATRYVATDAGGIPTGAFPPVAGTPLDLRTPRPLGMGIDSRVAPMGARGYNHAWLFDKPLGALAPVARLDDPASGRTLTVETTEPSIQVYTGGYIDGQDRGPSGKFMKAYDGVALETQHLSDSPNHPEFPSTVLRPGQIFRSTTIWRFGVKR